jgi:hypothetical protein
MYLLIESCYREMHKRGGWLDRGPLLMQVSHELCASFFTDEASTYTDRAKAEKKQRIPTVETQEFHAHPPFPPPTLITVDQ